MDEVVVTLFVVVFWFLVFLWRVGTEKRLDKVEIGWID